MTSPFATATPNRLMACVSAKVWSVAGLAGPGIVSRMRELTLLFAGTLPDFAVALVNSLILPLVTRKPAQSSDRERIQS